MKKRASKIAKKTPASNWVASKRHMQAKQTSAPKRAAKSEQKAVALSIEAIPPTTTPVKPEGKVATILRFIAQALAEIMSATGWLPHSVRGVISKASKKRGIESTKDESGQRRYRLVD